MTNKKYVWISHLKFKIFKRPQIDSETTKIKIVDIKKLWNFIVDNFFIWNHVVNKKTKFEFLKFEIQIS